MAEDKARRRELTDAYRRQPPVGGVYRIVCTANEHYLLQAATDIRGIQNRFTFAQRNDSCIEHQLAADWKAHGKDSFTFEVLETLACKEEQSPDEFKADLAFLREHWETQFDLALRYD